MQASSRFLLVSVSAWVVLGSVSPSLAQTIASTAKKIDRSASVEELSPPPAEPSLLDEGVQQVAQISPSASPSENSVSQSRQPSLTQIANPHQASSLPGTMATLPVGTFTGKLVPSQAIVLPSEKPAIVVPVPAPEKPTKPQIQAQATPAKPSTPKTPEAPKAPATPAPSAAPAKPAATPAAPAKPPATPAVPAKPASPDVKPFPPTQPTPPAEPAKPAEMTKPAEKPAEKPVEKPAEPAKPATPAQPASTPSGRLRDVQTPDPGPSRPIGPAKEGSAPDYLNPSPNPLLRPSKPEEVKLQGIQPITLQQAIELAERNSQTLQVDMLRVDSSKAALREAEATKLPTLDFQAGLTNATSTSAETAENQLQKRPVTRFQPRVSEDAARQSVGNFSATDFSAGLELNYDLYTSGRGAARRAEARKSVREAELVVETTREQLRLDVTGDYYDLQEADESVRINQAAVRNNEISLRDAQALERAGLGTRFDVLRSEVQLADARQRLTSAIAQQQIRRRQLAQRLSLAPTIDLAAADPVRTAGNWGMTLEDSIILAYKNRAELERFLVQRDIANERRKQALAALGPRVQLTASYNVAKSLIDPAPPQIQDGADRDAIGFTDGYTLRAGVRWNLFDGGAAKAQATQQEVAMKIAETQFADGKDQIRFSVERGFAELRSSADNIQTTEKALEQARESLRLARLRFQAGVGTQTDVINAETDLTRAEGNRITAILGYNRALATLQRAVSNLPANVITPR